MALPDAFAGSPHRRFNPLTREWVLVSPHRNARPWLGTVEETRDETLPAHDAACHLCPGNTRASGKVNPLYDGPFVFTNDFPALLPDTPAERHDGHPVFNAETVRGTARVVCFSPRHDLNLPRLPVATLRRIVDSWAEQTAELGRDYAWVAIFENKGAMMGVLEPAPARTDMGDRLPSQYREPGRRRTTPLPSRKPAESCWRTPWMPRSPRERVSSWRTTAGWWWSRTGRCGPTRRCCCRGETLCACPISRTGNATPSRTS